MSPLQPYLQAAQVQRYCRTYRQSMPHNLLLVANLSCSRMCQGGTETEKRVEFLLGRSALRYTAAQPRPQVGMFFPEDKYHSALLQPLIERILLGKELPMMIQSGNNGLQDTAGWGKQFQQGTRSPQDRRYRQKPAEKRDNNTRRDRHDSHPATLSQ